MTAFANDCSKGTSDLGVMSSKCQTMIESFDGITAYSRYNFT